MPSDIQVHGHVPLSNANISEETKLAFNRLLKKFDSIISKRDNDTGQMDLIEMHIATRLDSPQQFKWYIDYRKLNSYLSNRY